MNFKNLNALTNSISQCGVCSSDRYFYFAINSNNVVNYNIDSYVSNNNETIFIGDFITKSLLGNISYQYELIISNNVFNNHELVVKNKYGECDHQIIYDLGEIDISVEASCNQCCKHFTYTPMVSLFNDGIPIITTNWNVSSETFRYNNKQCHINHFNNELVVFDEHFKRIFSSNYDTDRLFNFDEITKHIDRKIRTLILE